MTGAGGEGFEGTGGTEAGSEEERASLYRVTGAAGGGSNADSAEPSNIVVVV